MNVSLQPEDLDLPSVFPFTGVLSDRAQDELDDIIHDVVGLRHINHLSLQSHFAFVPHSPTGLAFQPLNTHNIDAIKDILMPDLTHRIGRLPVIPTGIEIDYGGNLVFASNTRDTPVIRNPSTQGNCAWVEFRLIVGIRSNIDYLTSNEGAMGVFMPSRVCLTKPPHYVTDKLLTPHIYPTPARPGHFLLFPASAPYRIMGVREDAYAVYLNLSVWLSIPYASVDTPFVLECSCKVCNRHEINVRHNRRCLDVEFPNVITDLIVEYGLTECPRNECIHQAYKCPCLCKTCLSSSQCTPVRHEEPEDDYEEYEEDTYDEWRLTY